MFVKLSHSFRADFSPIAANYNVLDPVFHHKGKLRALIPFPQRGYRLSCVLKAIAVKTMMD